MAKAQTILRVAQDGQIDSALQSALEVIGTAWRADRAYNFVMRDLMFVRNTHEWCAPGIAPVLQDLQQVPYNIGETFWTAFREHGFIHIADVSRMPMGTELRQVLAGQNVRSLFAVPVHDGLEVTGFIGLDFCQHTRTLSPIEIPLLQCLAAMVGQSLDIHRLHDAHTTQKIDLRIANERIAAMVSALPELLVETDRTGLVTGFHQSPQMTLALSPSEVLGLPPEAFLPAHVARICRKAMAQVDEQDWSENFDYPLLINGTEKRFSLQATARGTGSRRRIRGYLFIIRDITESYLQDQQNRQLARIAELSTNLIVLTDASGRITWMNPASIERTGISLTEAIGKSAARLLRLTDSDPLAARQLGERQADGAGLDAEIQALSKSGMPYWIKVSMRPLSGNDGSLQGFMIVGNDVTTQKLAETRALRDRATAMDALPEGIAMIQRDGRCTYLNPALRTILDLPLDVPAMSLSWHDISPEPFNRQLVDVLPQLYAQGTWRGEFTLPQSPHGPLHFDISISVQEDGGFLFISRNITSRKQAEREQALLREQVQVAQSRQLVAQLASGLAHDVANVLAVISHVTASLKTQPAGIPGDALARIDAANTQAQALVANLSRLGKRSTRQDRLDLRSLISQAADLVRPSLDAGTRFEITLPDTPLEVLAEATGVMQVVLNLVLNARDAISGPDLDPDKGNACISLELKRVVAPTGCENLVLGQFQSNAFYALLRVCDTGEGMDPDTAPAVFDPYVSSKGDHGIGLGLSIVADIIRSTQGVIRIETMPGKGTCLQVFWPLAAEPVLRDTDSETQGTLPLAGTRILLVDDDDEILRCLSLGLTDAGAEVGSCIDPRDALAALRGAPDDWDLIVTDHDMGPMTGTDLATAISAMNDNLPIILVTGASPLQIAPKPVHPAIAMTLRKPISADLLVAVILDLLLRSTPHGPSQALVDAPSDSR
ncbi:MAG: PAS domain-containing protein [Roseinatronobacter sp.]